MTEKDSDGEQIQDIVAYEDLHEVLMDFKERLDICTRVHNNWEDKFGKAQAHLDQCRIKMYRIRQKFEKLKALEHKVLVECGRTVNKYELQKLWERISSLSENREIAVLHLWSDFSEASAALLALFRHLYMNQGMLNHALVGLEINVNLLNQLRVELPDYRWADNNFCPAQFSFTSRMDEVNKDFEEHSAFFEDLLNYKNF